MSDNSEKPQQETPKELDQNDIHTIQNMAQKILNPNNDNPQINEYIQSTFAYIGQALMKMQTSNDKQATAKEIADDLTQRFEAWVKAREESKKEQEGTSTQEESK